jgi:hypothetical protein
MQSLVKNINTNVVHMLEALRIEAGDFVAEDIPTFRDLTLALEGRKNLISDIKRLRFPLDEAEIKQLQLLGKEYQKLVNGLAGIQDRLADYIVKRQLSIDKKERQEESMASANNHWKQNIITLVIVLGIILISFFVLDLSAAITFSFVLLILAPVLLAFTQNAQSIKGINLLKLYEVGLSQGLVAIKALPKFLLRSNPKSSSTNSGS